MIRLFDFAEALRDDEDHKNSMKNAQQILQLLLASPKLQQIFWCIPDETPRWLCFINANGLVQCLCSSKCQQKPFLGKLTETLAY